jgi:hypothetical protein
MKAFMKANLGFFLIGLAGILSVAALNARANFEVSAAVNVHATPDFDAPLSPRGAWIEVGSYGRCWRPAGVAADWRPYCYGHWVWTDCGCPTANERVRTERPDAPQNAPPAASRERGTPPTSQRQDHEQEGGHHGKD